MAVVEGSAPRNLPGSDAPERISTWQQLALNLFWFANNFHWQALLAILIPSEVAKLLGDAHKTQNLPLVVVWGTLVAFFVNPMTGALSDYARFKLGRRRPFMIIGTIPNVIAVIGFAYAQEIGQAIRPILGGTTDAAVLVAMALLFVVVQFSNNFANAPWSAIIADKVPANQRGSASGFYGLMSLLGTIAGVIIAGNLVNSNAALDVYKHQLLMAYGAIAVIQVIVVTITVLTVKERPITERRTFRWSILARLYWISPRKYPDFVWILFTRLLMMVGIWAIFYFLQYFFDDVLRADLNRMHISGEAAVGSYFLPVVMVGALVTTVIAGKVSDRIGRKKLVYAAGALMSVVCLLFIFAQNFTGALIAAAFFGLGWGAYTSVDWALATDVLPPTDEYGKDMGIWTAAGIIPQVIGIVLGGVILSALKPLPNHQGYSVLFGIVVLFFVAGTFFVYQVKGAR
ncbi:MAG TPA: MFS transporter [Ktedonobacterales bacterium]